VTPTAGHPAPTGGGLLSKLMATVRPQFRVEVYLPDPEDRVLGRPSCRVAGCDRLAYCEVLADAGERLAPAGVGDGIVGLSMGDHSLAGAIDQARPVAVGKARNSYNSTQQFL